MTLRENILCTLLLAATSLYAQPSPLHICVVQPWAGYSSGEPLGVGVGGYDAKILSKELATRKLADGTPIQVILIVRKHRKDAEDEAQHQDCPFIVELWDHNIPDLANSNGAPVPAGSPTAGIPSSVPAHGDIIDNGIEWAMTRSDSRKVIARGFAPPGLRRRQLVVIPPPIPIIANQVVDKLNRIEKR